MSVSKMNWNNNSQTARQTVLSSPSISCLPACLPCWRQTTPCCLVHTAFMRPSCRRPTTPPHSAQPTAAATEFRRPSVGCRSSTLNSTSASFFCPTELKSRWQLKPNLICLQGAARHEMDNRRPCRRCSWSLILLFGPFVCPPRSGQADQRQEDRS
ncbi:hypothetical protein LZ31DRAFT_536912 [Colletotrichum somersetense]|nr:hypothetical protein LZ31DRAFT_536912 [Colletotrichum somersetense]